MPQPHFQLISHYSCRVKNNYSCRVKNISNSGHMIHIMCTACIDNEKNPLKWVLNYIFKYIHYINQIVDRRENIYIL